VTASHHKSMSRWRSWLNNGRWKTTWLSESIARAIQEISLASRITACRSRSHTHTQRARPSPAHGVARYSLRPADGFVRALVSSTLASTSAAYGRLRSHDDARSSHAPESPCDSEQARCQDCRADSIDAGDTDTPWRG